MCVLNLHYYMASISGSGGPGGPMKPVEVENKDKRGKKVVKRDYRKGKHYKAYTVGNKQKILDIGHNRRRYSQL